VAAAKAGRRQAKGIRHTPGLRPASRRAGMLRWKKAYASLSVCRVEALWSRGHDMALNNRWQ